MCQLVKLALFEPNEIQNGRQNVLKMKKKGIFLITYGLSLKQQVFNANITINILYIHIKFKFKYTIHNIIK